MKRFAKVGSRQALRGACIAALAFYIIRAPVAEAQDMPVPIDVQASLLPKILSFARPGPDRKAVGGPVGIVYQSQVRSSFVSAKEMAEMLPRYLRTADGEPIRCQLIEYLSGTDLSERLEREEVTMVYVAPMRSVDMRDIGTLLQNLRLLSYTGVPSYVESGLVFGVEAQGNRPKIVVNLPAARAIGMEFSSQLLKLSRVIE